MLPSPARRPLVFHPPPACLRVPSVGLSPTARAPSSVSRLNSPAARSPRRHPGHIAVFERCFVKLQLSKLGIPLRRALRQPRRCAGCRRLAGSCASAVFLVLLFRTLSSSSKILLLIWSKKCSLGSMVDPAAAPPGAPQISAIGEPSVVVHRLQLELLCGSLICLDRE